MKYDIIIPTIYRDYYFLKKVVKYIIANLEPDNIFIITNKTLCRYISNDILQNKLCCIIYEDDLLPELTYNKVQNILIKHRIANPFTGWYFQQFIKMGFALSNYANNTYYLSWDSDTLPIKHISFFDSNEHPMFTMKTEHHQPYFNSISRLLGIKKNTPKSYIAEHMLFNRGIMCELINEINNSTLEGDIWYEKIISSIDNGEPHGFSEFETYGTYCKNKYPHLYKERHLPGFRYGGFIQGRFINDNILKKLSPDIAYITFEVYHTPPFPWNVICNLQNMYFKKKERLILKLRQV